MTGLPNASYESIMRKWDREFFSAFDRKLARFFVLLRHRRSRKSTTVLNLLIREACTYPKRQYAYIFPIHKEAVKSIWRNPMMLFNYLPSQREIKWTCNESDKFIKFANGSYFWLFGADDPPSLRGPDYHGVGISEYAYTKPEVWDAVIQPIIRVDDDRFAIFDYTPNGQNHGLNLWNQAGEMRGWWRQELKASQSGIIPADELEDLKKTMPKWLFEQEYECSFITDEDRTLITSRMLDDLKNYAFVRPYMRKIVACDPDCSLDGDECVIYYFENEQVKDENIFNERDTSKIAHQVNLMCQKHGTNNAIVDNIGVGEGVWSELNRLKINVQRFDSRESAIDERFKNKRCEAYWYLMEQAVNHKLAYITDSILRQDLCSVKADGANPIRLEEKKETRKRLGRSPDRGDTYMMGIWGLKQVEPEKQEFGQGYFEKPEKTEMAESYNMNTAF